MIRENVIGQNHKYCVYMEPSFISSYLYKSPILTMIKNICMLNVLQKLTINRDLNPTQGLALQTHSLFP